MPEHHSDLRLWEGDGDLDLAPVDVLQDHPVLPDVVADEDGVEVQLQAPQHLVPTQVLVLETELYSWTVFDAYIFLSP